MRHASRLRRAVGALIAASLAAGLLAIPASAGSPSTVHVAPGPGNTGAITGGSCASPDHRSIQEAVDAVVPGSTILVCPGTYREQVTVTTPGLTIKGTEPWKAVLKPPVPSTAGSRPAPANIDLLTISGADGVTVQWLKLVAPTKGDCVTVDRMILVTNDADDTVIRANRIRPGGRDTFGGPCAYGTGIFIVGGSSALVTHNLVQDFRGSGIVAYGAGTSADIHRNSVRYRHAAEAYPGYRTGFGIWILTDAQARVRANALVGLGTAGTSTPQAANAILIQSTGVVVRRNRVRYAYNGILLVGASATSTRVRENTVLDGTGTDCYDNDVAANTWNGNIGTTSTPAGLCTPPAP